VSAMSDLAIDVRLLAELVSELDVTIITRPLPNLDTGLTCWASLEETNGQLATIRKFLTKKLAEAMPGKLVTVMGVGTFARQRIANRKRWDKDLYRAVLDTRLVNPETGEILDETPLEKVLGVWNLGAPRITALRERGIDPDEWCEVEYGHLTIQKLG
jgi:hypothetical protein